MNLFNTRNFIFKAGMGMLSFCLLSQTSFAQSKGDLERLNREFERELTLKMESDKAAVESYISRNNITTRQDFENGTYGELQFISPDGFPVYYVTSNAGAAKTTRATSLNSGGSLGLEINGEGMVAGVWDGGPVRATHSAFEGRVTQGDGLTFTSADGNNNHATHVSGTVGASLSAGQGYARGMAFKASLLTYDWNNDMNEAYNAADNSELYVSNHSYGYGVLNPSTGQLMIAQHTIGKYDETASTWDQIMYLRPYYQMVNAAGNDRQYQAYITNKGGYDLLTGHSCSKNAIVVAAVKEVANYTGPSSVGMSSFSNWGPTDDGRIKPDISGKGVDVYSCTSYGNNTYAALDGTSMASPNVTGTLVLLQQYYKELNGGPMYAAMLRGLALHSADEAGDYTGPDYRYGWGLMNAEAAAEIIKGNGSTSILESHVLNNSGSYTVTVESDGTSPLAVTICWTDPHGNANTSTTLDDATPALVNDLDIRVSFNGQDYMPWKLNPNNPSAAATTGDNTVDNIEKVYIANPSAGTYTITVTHKGTLANSSQRFALIASGISDGSTAGGGNTGGGNTGGGGSTGGGTGTTYCKAAGDSVADEWIAGVTIGSFSNTSTASQSTDGYTDYTSQTVSVETGDVGFTFTPGYTGQAYSEYWRVWIDLNEDGDFDDAGELMYDAGAAAANAVSGTMSIPASAAGVTTRMRIAMRYNGQTTAAPEPCGSFDYGEVEDYTIEINAPAVTGYCAALSNSVNDEWIAKVQVGSFINSSDQSQSSAGYTDYTNEVITMVSGANTISLSPGYSGQAYSEYWKVWIDYNGDSDFDDAGELVYDAGGLNTTTVTGTIDVPASAIGTTTRMRVIMKYNGAAEPCETFDYGEIEDYTVTFEDGGASAGAPTGYCATNGNNSVSAGSEDEWIDLVEVGGFSNATGAEASGYGDYTNLTGDLEIGSETTVYFSAGFGGTAYSEYWRIWIDLNRDGDFDDSGELLIQGYSDSDGTLRANLAIPSNASEGLTRMRVSMKYKEYAEPCESFAYGEVEDYTINMISNTTSNAAIYSFADFSNTSELNYGALEATPDMVVYPNPTAGNVTLELDRLAGDMDYSIIAVDGKVLRTGMITERMQEIQTANLPAGTYFIRATNGKTTYTQKFVKLK